MKNDAVLWSRCLKHVMDETGEKPQTKCRRHMLMHARKIWPMHCRSCAGLFLCFLHFRWHAPYATGCDAWNVKRDNEISDHAVSGACWREQKKNDQRVKEDAQIYLLCFLLCFLTCSVCLLWNSVHVNRERCEERRSDKRCMKKMQKQMHEYRICTRSCMEKYVSEKLCRIPYHVEYTWHAVAWCCFGETAC